MKKITVFILMFFSLTVFGQTKDRRAELNIWGRVNEISVSPDEKIWLTTAMGNTYYTDNIDSNWHHGELMSEPDSRYSYSNPSLGRISFFNKDTAIMTGYISVNKEESKKNGYYLTKDAGSTWQLLDFGGNSWIYNVFVDKQGNAWMGGSSGEIYFSSDFGQHWEKLNSPYNSFSRMHSVFMLDSIIGISGALHNDIYTTSNNWKTYKKIETPYDQQKYNTPSNDRIEKVLIWGNFIVVNQNGHIYYTETNDIDWKSFPIKICDFELDKDSQTLFAITDSLEIITFTSPTEFHLLTDKRLLSYPIDIKVVNGSLFVVTDDYDIYKINKNRLTYAIPYTTDKKIVEPKIVKQGKTIFWGISGRQIYLADDNTREWYRENALEFYIKDFKLLNDSVVILWDGVKNNYIYSLNDHLPKLYLPETPLKNFLVSPIKTFTIHSGSQGCFHGHNDEVCYKRVNDSIFKVVNISTNLHEKKESSTFKNEISSSALLKILTDINSNPSEIPSIQDFYITNSDKKSYLALVDSQLKNKEMDYLVRRKKINKDFYYAVPAMLDTLSNSVIATILNQKEDWTSRTRNWFTIQIINQNKDTLTISRSYFVENHPWHLPWEFEYKGQHFNCYNVEFSRFINSCIPDGFTGKKVFNNNFLIMKIADYLWNKEE